MLDSILSYDLNMILKSYFWHVNVKILSLCVLHCYGRHNIMILNFKTSICISILIHATL